MVGGTHAAVDGLAAFHALGPSWRAVGPGAKHRGWARSASAALGRTAPHHGALPGGEALFQASRRAAKRTHRRRSRRLGDTGRAAGARSGGYAARDRGARARRSGDGATCRGEPAGRSGDSGGANAGCCEACADGGARAQLWTPGDQAVGDAGAEDGESEQRVPLE